MSGNGGGLSVIQGAVLEMLAEGKTPRQISEVMGIPPAEAAKMAYDLLDREINTDIEQRRKLNVYRLERIVEALWQRVMTNANKDDVKNLVEVLDKLNVLLGLNKEQDAEMMTRMHSHQFAAYMAALTSLLAAFKMLAPKALTTEEEWASWGAVQLTAIQEQMTYAIEQ